MQQFDPPQATSTAQQEENCDTVLREQLERQAMEAAERATFHRIEAERWERIGRGALAGVHELLAVLPVESVTLDSLAPCDGGTKAVDLEMSGSTGSRPGVYRNG